MKYRGGRLPSMSPLPNAVLSEHLRHNPEDHGEICWDCEKPLDRRVTHVCRGIMDSGQFGMFSLCQKCGKREWLEATTGRTRRERIGRRLFLASIALLALSVAGQIVAGLTGFADAADLYLLGVTIAGVLLAILSTAMCRGIPVYHLPRKRFLWTR